MMSAPARRAVLAAKIAAGGLLILALLCAAPVAVIEGSCVGTRDPDLVSGSRYGIDEPGYQRAAGDSYMLYPEWDIAYAYADLAAVTTRSGESAFGYVPAIRGFWTSLCGASASAGRAGGATGGRKTANYLGGLAFTAEMALAGAYENTLGALTAWWRGPDQTPEDALNARILASYATFIRQEPWHRYPYGAELGKLWDIPFEASVRAIERRAWLTLRLAGKGALAGIAGYAAGPETGAGTIRSLVADLDVKDLAAEPRIVPIRYVTTTPGRMAVLMETPRQAAFTDVLRELAARNRDVLEIAGNRRILTTVLVPDGKAIDLDGAYPIFTIPLQAEPGWRRVGYDTEVASLSRQIRSVAAKGGRFERAYDY